MGSLNDSFRFGCSQDALIDDVVNARADGAGCGRAPRTKVEGRSAAAEIEEMRKGEDIFFEVPWRMLEKRDNLGGCIAVIV